MQPDKASVYDRHGRREVLTRRGGNQLSFLPAFLPSGARFWLHGAPIRSR